MCWSDERSDVLRTVDELEFATGSYALASIS